ncbi:MAG TPA: squalene/phytoene synthase family protein [Steroidobacteraceae bacterium]|nr:squalene/phytoene synthase family protein [Steroidobacteraceae bacterium]
MSPARPAPAPSAMRALAWLYAPGSQRPVLAALGAIEEEIGASLRPGLDHQVAHLRLEWWRAECARTAQGRPAHPLTHALTEAFAGGDPAPLAGLAGLVDTAVWDLAAATPETQRELTGYCERWAEAMVVPLARFAAPQVDAAAIRALGAGLREGELLARLAPDAHAGRLRLPLDELAAAQVDPSRLAVPPWPAALAALVSAQHRALRQKLATAVAGLPREAQPALRTLLVWAALADAASRRAEWRLPQAPSGRDDHAVLDGWRAWRAARRAEAGRFRL